MNYFNYFSEIEELFIRRRGRNLLLSPLDWALIESWQEREVPLHIILRGIEKIFDQADKQPNKKRTVKSLLYCKEEIEAQYAEWLERQVGKASAATKPISSVETAQNETKIEENPAAAANSGLFSDETISAHLENIAAETKAAQNTATGDLLETLKTIETRLAALQKQRHTAESLEDALEKLDAQIDESLLRHFEINALKGEVEKQIATYKTKMEPEVYRRTFDLILLKRLRERAAIPRLSLFYL